MLSNANALDLVGTIITAAGVIVAAVVAKMVHRRGREHGELNDIVVRIDERTKITHKLLTHHIENHHPQRQQTLELSIEEES